MAKTDKNLQEAFAGESQANRRYVAFSAKARADGHEQVSKLFRAVAAAETVHALAHLRVLGGIKDTAENLKAAIAGEGEEFKEMYPKFVDEAESDANKGALVSFRYAMAVEEVHHALYSQALKAVENGQDLEKQPVHVCSVCGNTVLGAPPETCPVCNSPKAKFEEVA